MPRRGRRPWQKEAVGNDRSVRMAKAISVESNPVAGQGELRSARSPSRVRDKAAQLASRLRLLQLQTADREEAERRVLLRDQIERALADEKGDEKARLLRELQVLFPVWTSAPAAPPAAPSPPAPDSAETVVARFRSLSHEERQQVVDSLLEQKLIEVPEAAEPENGRASTEALGQLVDFTEQLAKFCLTTLGKLDATGPAIKESTLRRKLDNYLQAPGPASRAALETELRTWRNLALTLVGAPLHIAEICAGKIADQWHPSRIEFYASQNLKRKPMLMAKGEWGWECYKELAQRNMTERSLAQEINQAVSDWAQKMRDDATVHPGG